MKSLLTFTTTELLAYYEICLIQMTVFCAWMIHVDFLTVVDVHLLSNQRKLPIDSSLPVHPLQLHGYPLHEHNYQTFYHGIHHQLIMRTEEMCVGQTGCKYITLCHDNESYTCTQNLPSMQCRWYVCAFIIRRRYSRVFILIKVFIIRCRQRRVMYSTGISTNCNAFFTNFL